MVSVVVFVCHSTGRIPTAARRSECLSNLNAIAAAVEQYAADHNGQWPEDIVAEDGRPLLSWRVRILEQLGYSELYRRFDTKQAWDSEINSAVGHTAPHVYRCPFANRSLTDESLRGATNYFLVESSDGGRQVRENGLFFVVWTRPTSLSAAEFTAIERVAFPMHGNANNSVAVTVHLFNTAEPGESADRGGDGGAGGPGGGGDEAR